MTNKIVVKRYADAFIEFAKESIDLDKAIADLKAFRGILRDNPEFEDFLRSPKVSQREKVDLIERLLGKDFSQELKDFLSLLLEKRRIDVFTEIAEYVRVTYAHGEEVEALLKTSYPLELELIQAIKDRLEKKLKKKLNLYLELDPQLLGGAQVVIGNTIIDGSVKKRLFDLEQKLNAVRVV